MLFLVFAVLFGSVHVTPWSHEHVDAYGHSHDVGHDDHEGEDADLNLDDQQPAKKVDVSGDIGHSHSIPTGIESAGNDFDGSAVMRQSIAASSQVTILSSLSRAPPTQPPSA